MDWYLSFLTSWCVSLDFTEFGLDLRIGKNINSEGMKIIFPIQFSSVQSLSHVRLFVTPWIAAHQSSLSISNSRSSPKLLSIELVMPSSHLILGCPLLLLPPILPSIRVFSNESIFAWGGQSTGVSASESFPPKKSQGCLPQDRLVGSPSID